ncbi:DUF6541 family protein [Phycicoccus sonneratiae]|uniref:Uncharacterized protein n=1 Tax=Phycicoccus sonneratiae TaxID=2807628 RepID=A0ABS2CPK5_9MICO|nr:DUF6541 family protein [Phycicoccus sonneraticus]MBM6400989.1 hypothetical protein [Phycicoccus sonneraticus]
MISPDVQSWSGAAPVLLATLALLLLPGGVALRLARADRVVVLGAAGPLTVGVLTLAGVLSSVAGLAWSPLVLVVVTLLAWGAGAAVGRARRSVPPPATAPTPWALVAGSGVAAVLAAWPLLTVTGAADALPQQPDTIFHLETIRAMVEQHDVSTLHAQSFVRPDQTGFYPAAFHAVAATVVQLTGCDVAVAAGSLAVVSAALLWPAAMTHLATTVLGRRDAVALLAPVVSVAFTAFPTWLAGYGVLWPNLLGQALLPAALAVGLGLLRSPRSPAGWVLLVLLVGGLGAAHPNAVAGLAVLGGAALGWTLVVLAVRAPRPGHRLLAAAAAVVLVAGGGAAWYLGGRLAPSMRESNPPGPEMSWRSGLVDVLFSAPRSSPALWVTGALVLLGLVLALRRARTAWVPLAWLVVGALYLAVAVVDSPRTRLLTWPWFNNSPRLAVLLVVPMALLVTAALVALAGAGRRVAREDGRRGLVRAAAVGAAFLLVTLGANASARAEVLRPYFPADDRATWVSRAELRALDDLGADLPAGAVVAANPWRGGSYLGLLHDVRMLFPNEKTLPTDPVQQLLGRRLDEAASDPEVCAAATRLDVGWAITGGEPASSSRGATRPYEGVDGVDGAQGWERVRTAGPYTLYRFAGCADG